MESANRLTYPRMQFYLKRVVEAGVGCLVFAAVGFTIALAGYKEEGWLAITISAVANIGLAVAFIALKILAWRAPDQ